MGMFDLTPEMVPYLQQQQDTQGGINAGNLGPQGAIISAANVGGNMLGRGAAGALGYQNPMAIQAQRLQQAMRDTDSSGLDYGKDPVSYMNLAAKNLFKYGLYDQGMSVTDKIKDLAQGQAAQATASQTNLKTSQEIAAERRVQQINQSSVGPNGYNQKSAIQAMMNDSNPIVQQRGISLAKEIQALNTSKYLPVQPGSVPFNTETNTYAPSPQGSQSVSWPGESSDETNRRVLTYYSEQAKTRPLSAQEQKDAEQRFLDYQNPQVQGIGLSKRPVTDALNPANWGQQPTPQSTPQSAPQSTPGTAGRTAPITTNLGNGGGREEAGIFQGAEGQKRLDDQTRQFSEYVTKNYIPQLDRAFSNVNAVLKAYPEDKTPGLGGAWNSPMAGYVMGIGQQIGSPELKKEMREAKDNRTSVVAVSNYITRLMAGLNQTQGESARIMMEQALGTDSTEADFRNAFQKLFQMYRDTRAGVLGGYPSEVRRKFDKQSGLNTTDISALPPPSMKTLPRGQQQSIPQPTPIPPPQPSMPSKLQETTGIEYLPGGKVRTTEGGRPYEWPSIETYNNYRKATGQ